MIDLIQLTVQEQAILKQKPAKNGIIFCQDSGEAETQEVVPAVPAAYVPQSLLSRLTAKPDAVSGLGRLLLMLTMRRTIGDLDNFQFFEWLGGGVLRGASSSVSASVSAGASESEYDHDWESGWDNTELDKIAATAQKYSVMAKL